MLETFLAKIPYAVRKSLSRKEIIAWGPLGILKHINSRISSRNNCCSQPSLQDIGRDRAAWLKTRVWKKAVDRCREDQCQYSPGAALASVGPSELSGWHFGLLIALPPPNSAMLFCRDLCSPKNSRSLQASRSAKWSVSPYFKTLHSLLVKHPFLALFSFPHPYSCSFTIINFHLDLLSWDLIQGSFFF